MTHFRPIVATLLLAACFAYPCTGSAQGRGQGYVFVAGQFEDVYTYVPVPPSLTNAGRTFKFSRAGGGWEWRFGGLALGLEGSGKPDAAEPAASMSYHFENLPKIGQTLAPFATMGAAADVAFGDGGLGIGRQQYFIGAGANVWLHRRIGPRIEIRRYDGGDPKAAIEFRVGVSFR